MVKRQRVPRYAVVASEGETPAPNAGDSNGNSNTRRGNTSPRRRSSSGSPSPPSTSGTTSRSNEPPKARNKIKGSNLQEQRRSSSSPRQKHRQQKRQQQQRQLAAEEILLQLLKACEKHHVNCHPDYHPRNEMDDSDENDLPSSCKSAITNLRVLIPKLECTIAPSDGDGKSTKSKTLTNDILQLCRFYDNVIRGNFCPHMPHLLGCGKDPQLILDKILYLLRNSLNVDLGNNRDFTKEEGSSSTVPKDRVSAVADTFLDVVSQTISGLMAFAVDDTTDHIRRNLFVDWIDFAEDLAVLSGLESQAHQRDQITAKANDWLPVELVLFEESSSVIKHRSRRTQEQAGRNDRAGGDADGNNHREFYSLKLHRWDQVRTLHTIVLNVLNLLTSDGSALERLQASPGQQEGEDAPSMLLGGDMDLFFPSDIVTDIELVSSLLASMKPVLLVSPDPIARSENSPLSFEATGVSAKAVDILIRLCLDWHRLGTSTASIPLLPCMIDAAVLTTRTILCELFNSRNIRADIPDMNAIYTNEKRLAFLLDRAVCCPPGLDNNHGNYTDDKNGVSRTIHSTVWTTLLDCIEGIVGRLHRRRQRNIEEYQQSSASKSDRDSAQSSASSVILDVAVLETIHYIAATTPTLALAGSNYCTAQGIFSHLFFLVSTTSLAVHNNDCSWNDDKLLLQAANQSLGVFLCASLRKDGHSAGLLDHACQGALKRHAQNTKQAVLQRAENVSNPGSMTGNGSNIDVQIGSEVSGVESNRRGSKRKREPLPQEASEISDNANRSAPCPMQQRSTIVYPTLWYEALGSLFDQALAAGESLKKSYATATTECQDFEIGEMIEEIRCLSGSLQLSLSLIQKVVMTACDVDQSGSISGISHIVHELSKQLLCACSLLLGELTTQHNLMIPSNFTMVDAVIGCGLSMHFSKLKTQEVHESLLEFSEYFLDYVSSFSGRILELEPQQQGGLDSWNKCIGIPTYFTGNKCRDHCKQRWCISSTVDSLKSDKHRNEWMFDRAIMTLHSLPLYVRAALVSSLHPVEQNFFSATEKNDFESIFGCYSLDLFSDLFNRYADDQKGKSVDHNSSRFIASLLHLLPLMVLSRHIKKKERAISRGNRGEQKNHFKKTAEASFNKPILLILKNGIGPLLASLKPNDSFLFQSLVSTLYHIDVFNIDADVELPIFEPTGILEFIVTRYEHLQCTKSKKDEVSSTLRGMMFDLADKGVRNDEDPKSRYLLWICAARYCISASPSEIRQKITLKWSQNASSDRDDQTSKDNSILSWLVATPFSDPNNSLRKFATRELSSILMSKEFSFLLARFSSSEDFQDYCTYSSKVREFRSEKNMCSLIRISDEIVDGLFHEIDRVLSEGCGFSETQLSLSLGCDKSGKQHPKSYRRENQLAIRRTAAKAMASLCFHANLSHPIGKTLFEKSTLRLIRMWASASTEKKESSFPILYSTSTSRALAFGGLSCLSESRKLSLCLSGEVSWTYFPSAIFCDVLILNNSKSREEQYKLLEILVNSFLTHTGDSLQKKTSAFQARKIVDESIPSTIAQLVNDKDEETIHMVIAFRLFMTERCESFKAMNHYEVDEIGVPEPAMSQKKSLSISMGNSQLQSMTKDLCLKKIDKILPLVLYYSDQEEALPLKYFMRLTAPVTLPDMMAGREQTILKGLAWELGRDPHRVDSAVRALRTAAAARVRDKANRAPGATPDLTAAHLWVTKNFMYLVVNMVQLHWGSRKLGHQVQALRCLNILLDFLDPLEAAQYFPQVLATVNVAIAVDKVRDLHQPDRASLTLHAVQCLSKFIRLSAENSIEAVIDNLTTIVVSLLPILEDDGIDLDGSILQEAKAEAVSMLEFLTRSKFVRKFSKAFSQIPFLPSSAALINVHKSLRDNGINFDNLLILSTSTSESQGGMNTRRESLTSDNTSNASFSSNGDNVLALQNRLSLISSLLDNENASVRKVSLQHLVDLLRTNRNLFHILVESDGGSSIRNYLTVIYDRNQNDIGNEQAKHTTTVTSVSISFIIEKLMNRCVIETNSRVRLQLATCLGEIGAIGENRLDDMSLFRSKGSESESMYEWRLKQPPWQSRAAKYELQLVTKCLVAALKAAPSQEEQLKIAFTIQQLLNLLDESARACDNKDSTNEKLDCQKREMSKWLMDRLVEANVYDSVEPYWLSEFSTKDERFTIRRQPPFFKVDKSYHLWISEFCRWMIKKAKDCPLSRWKDFFFACRIAIRSSTGLETAEFILPLIVLDRICFGSAEEFELICQEFIGILDIGSTSTAMSNNERRKAISGFFAMIDTLSFWAETETERRYRSKRTSHSKRSCKDGTRQTSHDNSSSNWPADETITQIEELVSRIPLIDQARAAQEVGMHAKGLRLLEMVARKSVVEPFFESSSDNNDSEVPVSGNILQHSLLENADLGLMKVMLSNMDDCETMNVIGETSYLANPLLKVADSVQWKEANGNFEGALRDYERALQVSSVANLGAEPGIERGALDCMLKLGRYESVLNRVLTEGRNADKMETQSFAIQAACHLGQWDKLSSLVQQNEASKINSLPDDMYRKATGKAILCLRDRDGISIADSFRSARSAVMEKLSSVARESYSKAYTEIVRLQCVRELEDAARLLCTDGAKDMFTLSEAAESKLHEGWAWDGRLKLTTPRAASEIMNARVAIARIGNDRIMEGSLLLDIGKHAHKNGMATVAENFYSQAAVTLSLIREVQNANHQKVGNLMDDVRVQYAKLKMESGENLLALKILGQEMLQDALSEMSQNSKDIEFLKKVAVKYERLRAEKIFGGRLSVGDEKGLISRFSNRLLRLTQWTVEGGMQSGNEIIFRFETVITLSPDWEKGHFQFARYLNELVTRFFEKDSPHGIGDDVMRFNALYRNKVCHHYILLAIEHYAQNLQLDLKHVYQTLPRLLSLWFDFVSVQPPESDPNGTHGAFKPEYMKFLTENQNRANVLMAENTKAIPAAAYYTAIPQLISRVIHNNEDTAKVVKRILERVLAKFPHQAMWHLAWLRGSKNQERSKIGGDIFKGAQRVLIKNRQTQVANLLKASDSLFKFLQDLAKFTPKTKSSSVSVKSWKGIADLSEFIPPVQAAMSITPFKLVKSSTREYFPRVIPRMRAFSSKVSVMQSKARPKKLKAFAVPGTWKHANVNGSKDGAGRASASTPLDCDIGEIHFLVKQEAKGDLRKDARVQDLNNVINRLMSSSKNSSSTLASRSRRLRVRTFAVTCLSEDTGILEWVPDTDSLRNLVHRSYNSQTSSFCPRRRGSRMTSFADATMRSQFERAQNQFLKNGDIAQAAKLYYLLCLKQHPPVLSWWFVQKFPSATDWYEARTKFTLTAAAWSAIGHVIGLGDRHSENILVETATGRVVHVDFDCIFDKGLNLPRPEVVPFRLTPNMLDAFGPTGADGMFSSGMECSLEVLRENRDTLLSVLEPFVKDPVIDWKRHRTQQNVLPTAKLPNDSHGEATRSIHVIKERLSGICNMRNPNYRKLRNIIPREHLSRIEQDNMTIGILPLSVEGQVQKLCVEASKNENLVQLYVGWMPWV